LLRMSAGWRNRIGRHFGFVVRPGSPDALAGSIEPSTVKQGSFFCRRCNKGKGEIFMGYSG